jgi:hypothetical protein
VLSAIARFLEGIYAILAPAPSGAPVPSGQRDGRWWIPDKAEPRMPAVVIEPATPPVVAAEVKPAPPDLPDFVTEFPAEAVAEVEVPADEAIPPWDEEAFAEFLETHRKAKEGTSEDPRFAEIEIPRQLELSEEAYTIADDWMKQHRAAHPLPSVDIYGQYWIRFSRSSLGDTATLGCSTCGQTKIVTELGAVAAAPPDLP